MQNLARFLRAIPLLLLSPVLVLVPFLAIAAADLLWLLAGRKRPFEPPTAWTPPRAASIVIPNWNGRDLLAKYLPSVVAAANAVPGSEVIVVENGSTDGSAAFVRENFPEVRLLALPSNLGFGGGSNAGFRAARNEVVVLLNSDMRVEEGFLPPLLAGFTDSAVFAVSCQIFLSDPKKRREETGLTQAWWGNGGLRVRHREDGGINEPYPCFYGGGGSCAFDRAKFLELGGFDELLRPFYLEDTDLGYLAWKRGWKVLYQPASVVWHEHRGTIGKRFSPAYIEGVLKKNFILFCWKNIHDWRKLIAHFSHGWAGALLSVFIGDSPERSNLYGIVRAFLQLPQALLSRWRARGLAAVSDTEAFLRPLGGYFRDRFEQLPAEPETLRVLFLSPYPICPPIHGGGVFMYHTLRELGRHAEVHVIALLDFEHERQAHAALVPSCRSMEFLIRMEGKSAIFASILPHAVLEFSNPDLDWLIHRQLFTKRIDIFQLEYTNMAQYAGKLRQIPCVLFEHDIYFQSIARILPNLPGLLRRVSAAFEYLRALRYELRELRRLDGIEVCTAANRDYLLSFAPDLAGKTWEGLRAGIDTSTYEFHAAPREPDTMLFLGSFRHLPNQEALDWFTREVMPLILERRPSARLIVIGSDPPPRYSLPEDTPNIEIRGFVDNIREPLARYALFVCPILSGSGVRVKLLEAFATGIPVVSTYIGAEGLATADGNVCRLAADPSAFAERVVATLEDPDTAAAMATRARSEVERNWDMAVITQRLHDRYRQLIREKRVNGAASPPSLRAVR